MRKIRLFELSPSSIFDGEDLPRDSEFANVSAKLISADEDKIKALVAEEINKQKAIMVTNFERELEKERSKLLMRSNAEIDKQKAITETLEGLVSGIGSELSAKLVNEVSDLKEIVVSLVMESLFKISSKELIKQAIAKDIAELLIEKITAEGVVSLNVSASDHKLLEALPSYSSIKPFLHIDKNLSAGQVLLEDCGSFYKVGISDRLDALRKAFTIALDNKNEL
ncbi:hypothetical protein GCM10011613_32490 [Cellvibrio zantedeschiae]|uniref:Flagellar assembly protein FliH/Type III secretion system HrpE domain-containing protein n=1 Tax=Cellvibrio zantedeschiae TaxID=1237077 RepID=A0ABQ3BD64_9GAMM|nr:hypothetical protein [Cellvibrio zantedeschiae]GGY84919.1 hypothetical protein GCM10011613_32490 [Cellvibrio zantedeschiae]